MPYVTSYFTMFSYFNNLIVFKLFLKYLRKLVGNIFILLP